MLSNSLFPRPNQYGLPTQQPKDTITHDRCVLATQDAARFRNLFSNLNNLEFAVATYPELKDKLFAMVIAITTNEEDNNKLPFYERFASITDFLSLTEIFPDKKPQLFEHLAQIKNFNGFICGNLRFLILLAETFNTHNMHDVLIYKSDLLTYVNSTEALLSIASVFTQHKIDLIERTLKNPEKRTVVIASAADIVAFCSVFPEYLPILLMPVLDDNTEYQRLIKSQSDLAALGRAFPTYQAALINRVVTDTPERARLVKQAQDLASLGVVFPAQQTALITPFLTDSTLRAQVIRSGYDLADLCIAFPAHQAALLDAELNDSAGYQRVTNSINDFLKLAEVAPSLHAELLKKMLSDPTECARIIGSKYVMYHTRILVEAFPIYQAELFDLILQCPDLCKRLMADGYEFSSLGSIFRGQHAALMSHLGNQPGERARLIKTARDLQALGIIFTQYHNYIIAPVLADAIKYKSIIDRSSDLIQLANIYPAHHSAILAPVLQEPGEYQRVIKSCANLLELGEAFPNHKAELLKPILTATSERTRLITTVRDLIELGKTFAAEQEALLEPLLTDSNERTRLLPNSAALKELLIGFPNYQVAILTSVLANASERSRVIKNVSELAELGKAFPAQLAVIIETALKDRKTLQQLIPSCQALNDLLLVFTEHSALLIDCVASDDAILEQLIESIDDIDFLAKKSPKLLAKISDLMLQSSEVFFNRVIKRTLNICRLAQLMPQQLAPIYARVTAIGLERFDIFTTGARLQLFVENFPAHLTDIFNYLLNRREILTNLIINDRAALNILLAIFPQQRPRVLIFASGCAPIQVACVIDSIAINPRNNSKVELCIDELEATEEGKSSSLLELLRWKNEFNKSNRMLSAHQKREFGATLQQYKLRILNLMIIMGPTRALTFLATLTSISAMQLTQFLSTLREIDTQVLVELLKLMLAKFAASLAEKKMIGTWKEIFLIITSLDENTLPEFKINLIVKIKQLLVAIADTQTLTEVLQKLSAVAKSIGIQSLDLNIAEHEVDLVKFDMLSNSRFWNSLLAGRRNLDDYPEWYNAMLACDITQRSLDDLLHNTQQPGSPMQVVAEHNAAIRTQLKSYGLKRTNAVYYKKSHAFTYAETKKVDYDWQQLALSIQRQLTAINLTLKDSALINESNTVRGGFNKIGKLLQELSKGKNPIDKLGERLQLPAIHSLIMSLNAKLPGLREAIAASPDSAGLITLLTNLDELFAEVKAHQPQIHTRLFRAQQWDKSRPDTFYLGSYLNCCLAPDGSQAQAMIERRLDDAMPIHVVIDEESNEPVCAAWLFWARDDNDDNLKLVANYFELNHANAKDPQLKDTLVCNLMYFTGELYLKDVTHKHTKTPAFMLRPLSYGNITNFTKFASVRCQFEDKLGGFCAQPNGCPSYYYLSGLENINFYLYTAQNLQKQFPNVSIVKPDIAPCAVKGTLFAERASTDVAPRTRVRIRVRRRV